MNPRIENLRGYILRKEHHVLRRTPARLGLDNLNIGFAAAGMPPVRRSAEMLAALMRAEQPVILPGEKIVFTRTVTEVPEIFTPQEWDGIKASHYIHERGTVCNISPDYETTIRLGLDARKAEIASRLADDSLDQEQRIFLGSVALCIEAVQELTGRYAAMPAKRGRRDTAQVLEAVRTRGARSLREALQLLRILHFAIWEAGNYHNTLGRFDQYMYPYFRHDIDSGVLTEEEAFDLVEEFFLACNKDSDLYPGMQQGDNGQSMVLGGRAANGDYLFNRLSEMCLAGQLRTGADRPQDQHPRRRGYARRNLLPGVAAHPQGAGIPAVQQRRRDRPGAHEERLFGSRTPAIMSWPPAGSSSSPTMRWTSPTSTPCRSSAACARCCPNWSNAPIMRPSTAV